MKDTKIKKIVITAAFMALTCIATMIIQIPSPASGYVNLGDCMVLLSAWLLGPWYGACAAGIGSALADLLSGYAAYAPITLLIKCTMAILAGLIIKGKATSSLPSTWKKLFSGFVAEIIMIGGYFLYEAILLGTYLPALSSVPGNIVQGIFGIISASILMQCLVKSHATKAFSYF